MNANYNPYKYNVRNQANKLSMEKYAHLPWVVINCIGHIYITRIKNSRYCNSTINSLHKLYLRLHISHNCNVDILLVI